MSGIPIKLEFEDGTAMEVVARVTTDKVVDHEDISSLGGTYRAEVGQTIVWTFDGASIPREKTQFQCKAEFWHYGSRVRLEGNVIPFRVGRGFRMYGSPN